MRRIITILLALSLFTGISYADGLASNSTPAERARGCSFAERFDSQTLVEKHNGMITGTPTFATNDGVTLNGTTDYTTHFLTGREFNNAFISTVTAFTPHFNWDVDADIYFYDADTAGGNERYMLFKQNNAGNNVLYLMLGETNITTIASATYSAYWLQNQRNVLVISSTTGNTSVWLNGNLILDAFATAWTQDPPTTLTIGARFNGIGKFDGTIHDFKVFHAKLTEQEAIDFTNNTTYTYQNSATASYQMRAEDHDPGNNRTLDSSGNGYHLTDVNDPVKRATHGYDFDGTNYFFRAGDGSFDMDLAHNPTGDFSIQFALTPDTIIGVHMLVAKDDGANAAWGIYQNGATVALAVFKTGGASTTVATGDVFAAHRLAFITATYDYTSDGNSIITFYVDARVAAQSVVAVGPVRASAIVFTVAAQGNGALFFGGAVHGVVVYKGRTLTRIQHFDFTIRAKKQLNDI